MENKKINLSQIPLIQKDLNICVDLIPNGYYCYTPIYDQPSNSQFAYSIDICPYWYTVREKEDMLSGYCSLLNEGDWQEDGGGLLWDQVKSCEYNLEYDE